jgi:hypothetical protein
MEMNLPQLSDEELDELAEPFHKPRAFDYVGYADALIHLLLKKFEETKEEL